jgi:hypothetical protein
MRRNKRKKAPSTYTPFVCTPQIPFMVSIFLVFAHKSIHELAAFCFFFLNSNFLSCFGAKGAPFTINPFVSLNYITWNMIREIFTLVMNFLAAWWRHYIEAMDEDGPSDGGKGYRHDMHIQVLCHVAYDNLKLMSVYP